jgi:4-amino-4-deoxy-L-arabinose transferase-like glycosyltransferase
MVRKNTFNPDQATILLSRMMTKPNLTSQTFLVLILVIAAFLRFYSLTYMEFKGDEGFNLAKALRLLEEGDIPLTSAVSSTGVNEPPLFMYILSLSLLFSTNPVFTAGFIATLNILGILVCYLFVKRFFDEKSALVAAAFYSLSPWQILFSRKIWTQNLLAPFIVLFLYLAFIALEENRKRFIPLACIVLGIILQLHMSGIYIAGLALILLLMHWKTIDKRYLAFGVVLFVCTFIPYGVFLVQNDFTVFSTAANVLTHKANGTSLWALTKIPFLLVSTKGFGYSLGSNITDFESSAIRIGLFDALMMFLLFVSYIYIVVSRSSHAILFGAWPVVGLVFFYLTNVKIHLHYFHSFFPLFFILLGILGGSVTRLKSRLWRFTGYALGGILLAYQLLFGIAFLSYIEKTPCIRGDYGAPYAYRLERLKAVVAQYPDPNVPFAKIHRLSCQCIKCDKKATRYLLHHMNKHYDGQDNSLKR